MEIAAKSRCRAVISGRLYGNAALASELCLVLYPRSMGSVARLLLYMLSMSHNARSVRFVGMNGIILNCRWDNQAGGAVCSKVSVGVSAERRNDPERLKINGDDQVPSSALV